MLNDINWNNLETSILAFCLIRGCSWTTINQTFLCAVVQFLRVTKQLPSTKDEYDFFQSYPSFMAFSKNQGQRVLQLIGKVRKFYTLLQSKGFFGLVDEVFPDILSWRVLKWSDINHGEPRENTSTNEFTLSFFLCFPNQAIPYFPYDWSIAIVQSNEAGRI